MIRVPRENLWTWMLDAVLRWSRRHPGRYGLEVIAGERCIVLVVTRPEVRG